MRNGDSSEALEEDGCHYQIEVEAIRTAHQKDMFTVAFVFDEIQTIQMIDAGADIICAHLGLTGGEVLGAKSLVTGR